MNSKYPQKIILQTQSFCNGKCKFCPYDDLKELNSHGTMSDELLLKIVDDCVTNQKYIDTFMPYLMNEPLLDKRLEKKIDLIKTKLPETEVHILSNGFLLDDKRSEEIINSKLDWIGISFFGVNKDYYEQAMGIPFEVAKYRVDRFIKRAIEKRGSDFVMITFFKWGAIQDLEVEEALEHWRGLGVTRISHFEKGISRAGNVKNFPTLSHTMMKQCNSIWTNEMIHILFNGDVILCCMDWRREHILGNVKEQTITEIWNGKKYLEVRKQLRGEKQLELICRNCEMAE